MNEIKKNVIYNMVYQILILIIPFITLPYVSRVLGADGVGIYSYTYSVVNYFMLLALLGISKYGNRLIAKVRDNKEKLSKEFLSLYTFQIFSTLIAIIVYLIYVFCFNPRYKMIAIIQILYLLATALDINWFFFGLEKFKITVTRNTIIKVISLILIFLLVRDKNSIWIYTLILSGSSLVSNMVLFPFLKKNISFVKISFADIKKHWKPVLILFLPVIAVSIYTIMDKIMLGIMSNMKEVGFYESAEKVIQAPLAIITAFGTVMMPRISNLISKNEEEKTLSLIEKTIQFILFISFPVVFGLICISKDFSIFFFGTEFQKTGNLLCILAINVLFFAWGNVIRTQYLIPKEKDREYVISGIIGAFVNLALNLILIPKYSSIGACIGTIASEFSVMFYQSFVVRNELPIKKYIKDISLFFIKALLMFIIIYPMNYLGIQPILQITFQVIIGGAIYFLLNISYICKIVSIKN